MNKVFSAALVRIKRGLFLVTKSKQKLIGANPIDWIWRAFLIIPVLLVVMIYTGFCFKQFRYISDDEKIRIAVEYVLKDNREAVIEYKDRAVVYPFNTVDEFLASNPITCEATSSLMGGLDWLDKIRGHLSSYVILEFMGVYKGAPKKGVRVIAITNCGDAWNPWD